MNKTVQDWFKDEEFKALPSVEKETIVGRFFDKELADDSFNELPENERHAIRSNFVDMNMEPNRPAPPDRGVVSDLGVSVARGAIGAGELVARGTAGAAQLWSGDESEIAPKARAIGKDIAGYRDDTLPVSRQAQTDPVRKAWTGGVESATISLLAVAPAVTLGALTGGAGAAAAGYLMGAPLFGAAQYDQSLEEFTKKGVPKDQAHMAALMMGASETGFELFTDALEIATVGFGGLVTKPLKSAARDGAKRLIASTWAEAGKRGGAVVATEMAGELANVGTQAEIERQVAGVGKERFWEAMKDQVGQIGVASLIFGAVGGGLHKARTGHVKRLITDPDADVEQRLGAVQEVYQEIARKDQGLAERWRDGAALAVLQGKAISDEIEDAGRLEGEEAGKPEAAAPVGAVGEDTTKIAQAPVAPVEAPKKKKTAAEILTGRPAKQAQEGVPAEKYPLVDDEGRRYRKFVSGGLIDGDERLDPGRPDRVYQVAPQEQKPAALAPQGEAIAVEDIPKGALPEVKQAEGGRLKAEGEKPGTDAAAMLTGKRPHEMTVDEKERAGRLNDARRAAKEGIKGVRLDEGMHAFANYIGAAEAVAGKAWKAPETEQGDLLQAAIDVFEKKVSKIDLESEKFKKATAEQQDHMRSQVAYWRDQVVPAMKAAQGGDWRTYFKLDPNKFWAYIPGKEIAEKHPDMAEAGKLRDEFYAAHQAAQQNRTEIPRDPLQALQSQEVTNVQQGETQPESRFKHFTTPERAAGIRAQGYNPAANAPLFGTGSFDEGPKVGRFAGDAIYLSRDDKEWGNLKEFKAEGDPRPATEQDSAENGNIFFDYKKQSWMIRPGKWETTPLEAVEFDVAKDAKVLTIDSEDSLNAASKKYGSWDSPEFWKAVGKDYDAVAIDKAADVQAKSPDNNFFKAAKADQLVILNRDKVKVVEQKKPKTDAPAAITGRTAAVAGTSRLEAAPTKEKTLEGDAGGQVQDGDLLNTVGKPYKNDNAARFAQRVKKLGQSHDVVPAAGGFVLRPKRAGAIEAAAPPPAADTDAPAGLGKEGKRVWREWVKRMGTKPGDRDQEDAASWFSELYQAGKNGKPLPTKDGGMPLAGDERPAYYAGEADRKAEKPKTDAVGALTGKKQVKEAPEKTKLQLEYAPEGPEIETGGTTGQEQAFLRDVRKFGEALRGILGYEHHLDKKGKNKSYSINIAPVGGDGTILLWKPNSEYGVYVSIPTVRDYDTGVLSVRDKFIHNGDLMWRLTTRKDPYGGLQNQWVKRDISAEGLAQRISDAMEGREEPAATEETKPSAVEEKPVKTEAVAETTEETKPLNVGENAKIVGVDSVLARSEIIDGIRYELFSGARLKEDRAAVQITDIESGRVVGVTQYENFDLAEAKFNQDVAYAKKSAAPAETEPAAASPPPSLPASKPLSEITVEIKAYSESGAAMTVREKADVALAENAKQAETARRVLDCLNI